MRRKESAVAQRKQNKNEPAALKRDEGGRRERKFMLQEMPCLNIWTRNGSAYTQHSYRAIKYFKIKMKTTTFCSWKTTNTQNKKNFSSFIVCLRNERKNYLFFISHSISFFLLLSFCLSWACLQGSIVF